MQRTLIVLVVASWCITIATVIVSTRTTGSYRTGEGKEIDVESAGEICQREFRFSGFLPKDWDAGPLISGCLQDIMNQDLSKDTGDLFIFRILSEKGGNLQDIAIEYSNFAGENVRKMLQRCGYVLVEDEKDPRKILICEDEKGGGLTVEFKRRDMESLEDIRFLTGSYVLTP